MAYPQERRTQVYTGPGFDNRPFRKGTIKGFSQKQNFDPRRSGADMAAFAEDELGLKADSQGNYGPTRDYRRDMMLGSQQRNSLSRGTPGGYASGLGNPLNSNQTPRGFSEGIQQRNQGRSREQNIAQAQREGTFDTIRDKFNLENKDSGMTMNKFGNISKMNPPQTAAPVPEYLKRPTQNATSFSMGSLTKGVPSFSPPPPQTPNMLPREGGLLEKRGFGSAVALPQDAPTASQAPANTGLQERAAGLRLLREVSQTPLQVTEAGGGKNLVGKYGTGWSAPATPGKSSQGLIGGRPVAEVMQGLAEKPGLARPGDKYQPKGMSAEEIAKARKAKK